MAKALTAAAVKKFTASNMRREIPDGGAVALFVVVQPSGAKSYAMRFRRPDGKNCKLTLGPVDLNGHEMQDPPTIGQPLTLAAARHLAADVHRRRALGQDVVAEEREKKHRQKFEFLRRAEATFAIAAKDFIVGHAQKHVRRWQEMAAHLGLKENDKGELEAIKGGLADRWRDKPVVAITADDIYSIVDEARRRGVPGLSVHNKKPSENRARKAHSYLHKMFAWLLAHRRVAVNPVASVVAPTAPKARDRFLDDIEIRSFWTATEVVDEPFTQALRLLLLTGCRRDEIGEMERRELNADSTMLTLPGSRTKNHREHLVPLPAQAGTILAGMKRIESRSGYVFTTTGKTPVSGWSKIKTRLDAAMLVAIREHDPKAVLKPWRIHDLRRTCSTHMHEKLGIPPHIVESAINHVSGARGGVAGTYNRALYLEERRAAFARWATHIDGLVAGRMATVVPMKKGCEGKMSDPLDFGIFAGAMADAFAGDCTDLLDLVQCNPKEVTPDIVQFLVGLVDTGKRGRPPLPAKFKYLKEMWHPLFDAAFDFHQARAHWLRSRPDERFPRTETIEAAATKNKVIPDQLSDYLKNYRKALKENRKHS